MRTRIICVSLIFITFLKSEINATTDLYPRNNAFDVSLYEEVLDHEKCEEELTHIFSNNRGLGLRFQDAGIRLPKGILEGNLLDLGNYHQCLNIKESEENLNIQGKYCSISLPMNQEIHFPSLPEMPGTTEWSEWTELKANNFYEENLKKIDEYNKKTSEIIQLKGQKIDRSTSSVLGGIAVTLAVCIPKTCTTKEYITKLWFNISAVGLDYTDNFCRLPNDRPWAPVDYVAVVIFSVIGLLVLLSTGYDVYHAMILKKDPKMANVVCQSFSAFSNTRHLFTFPSNPKAIECLDGIRAISMLWVILGHTASTLRIANVLETYEWLISFRGLWLMAATISVDTFFFLSGLLLVYTTSGKFSSMQLIRNIHLFYLHRILRVLPLLAAVILVQASFMNRLEDGPLWTSVADLVIRCRQNWWSTLLHIQNYVTSTQICLPHSWYLAVDMQVHILSPLILVWVYMKKENHIKAWIALITALMMTLAGSTTYNAIKKFGSSILGSGNADYMMNYYINTLTRASPLLVGMIFGYILYVMRGKNLKVSKVLVALLWSLVSLTLFLVLYAYYAPIQIDWDNTVADVLINSFMRATWACALGIMVIACAHGYGGPVNGILSHGIWKLPSRLSYAMYLIHYPLMYIGTATRLYPTNFAVGIWVFQFLSYVSLTILLSIFATIIVDSPFANIIKLIMNRGSKDSSPNPQKETGKNGEAKPDMESNEESNDIHKQKEEK